MENEIIDVQPAEETAPSSSEVEQTTEASQEVEEVKQVPYDRFKEVVDQRNQYKELLNTQQQGLGIPKSDKTTQQQIQEVESTTGEAYEDALKLIDNRVEAKLSRKLDALNRQIELDKTVAQNPDFFQYSDLIKQKIQENPHLSWSDAYKLSKFDVSISQAKEMGKQEAYKKIGEKKSAIVETTAKAKPAISNDTAIDPLAKGPDGKFLYSTKELEDILPKT